jgi:hypothetical protein
MENKASLDKKLDKSMNMDKGAMFEVWNSTSRLKMSFVLLHPKIVPFTIDATGGDGKWVGMEKH